MNRFEKLCAAVILTNTGLLVWAQFDGAHEELLKHIESVCLAFFVVELVVRIRSHGWRRFVRSPWCVFDSTIIALALLPVLGADVSLLRVARLARVVHLMRHASHMRLLRLIPAVGMVRKEV
jgi:voltage-gated sodium channel